MFSHNVIYGGNTSQLEKIGSLEQNLCTYELWNNDDDIMTKTSFAGLTVFLTLYVLQLRIADNVPDTNSTPILGRS